MMGAEKRARLASWAACLLLLVLPFLLFWQVWWPDPAQRRVFADGDFVEQHYPMRAFVAQEYRQGRLPLWSPYTFSGEPVVAESLYTVFYPLGLWELIFPVLPFWALEVEAVFYLGLAGVFTFLFVRCLTGRWEAGLLAGVAFSLSGFLTSYPMLQMIILQVALWLPAGLWLLERALQRHSLWGLALAGAVLGIGILGGHFQTFLYITYVTAAYYLFRSLHLRVGTRFMALGACVLGLAVLGAGAPQWLPSLEMAGMSPRADLGYEVVSHGFAPRELWGIFRPNPGEWSPLYVGLIPLALGLLALAFNRRAEVGFWGGVALVALGLSLGHNGLLYPLFYKIAPGFQLFRDQERAVFLFSFAFSVLAGYGLTWLMALSRAPKWLWALLIPLTFGDLYRANNGIILQVPPEGGYTAPTPALTYLQRQEDPLARVSSEASLPLGANAALFFGLRDVTGNGPLYQARYELLLDLVPEVRWWQLLNVRHVVTPRFIDFPGVRLALDDPDRDERVHRLELGGQPLWIVHDAVVMPDQEAAVWYTSDMGLVDPSQTAVLEVLPVPEPGPAAGEEAARVTAFGPQRVVAEVQLSAPGVVVFSEVAYPGWRAWANGSPVDVLRAFGVLRAVALPAGTWEIVWQFQPVRVYVGLGLALLTWMAIGGVALLPCRARENKGGCK